MSYALKDARRRGRSLRRDRGEAPRRTATGAEARAPQKPRISKGSSEPPDGGFAAYLRPIPPVGREGWIAGGLKTDCRWIAGGLQTPLRLPPSPQWSRIVQTLVKYYKYLEGAEQCYIILENGPSSSSHPMGVWTVAERRDFPIHVPSTSQPCPIHVPSNPPERREESSLGKPQTTTPRGPNDYPKRRVLEGFRLPSASPTRVTSL